MKRSVVAFALTVLSLPAQAQFQRPDLKPPISEIINENRNKDQQRKARISECDSWFDIEKRKTCQAEEEAKCKSTPPNSASPLSPPTARRP